MYPLSPPAVYAHESVTADSRYQARLQRVLDALETPVEPIIYADEDLPQIITRHGLLDNCGTMGEMDVVPDPKLVLNTFRFDGRRKERVEWLTGQADVGEAWARALLGYQPWRWEPYNLPGDAHRHDKVCRPCWRLHFQRGCAHKCAYCGLGGLLVSAVNSDEWCEHLGRLMDAHPWQETYLLEDDADVPGLEPELGCLGEIIEWFGTLQDRYVIIHTKSWNADWMTDLAHNGNTIIVWSISGETQSREIEPVCGTMRQRIEAARTAQDAGYQVRYKFKPIIPVRNWREEASEAIDLLFDRTAPDVISLCVFMWHDVEAMKRKLPVELLDPRALKAAEEAGLTTADTRSAPFPEDVRAEIYLHYLREIRRHDPDIPVSLSTENFRMWKRLEGELGCSATDYVCGCGPNSTPGRACLEQNAFEIARGGPQGDFDEM
ncbi:MAG: spore photoproduct lyase family protein [Armatimonadota bacterium]|jgi:DNA repair photolyase